MSNLKKILALVLALVMSFSLVTVSSAALQDTATIDENYAEAAQVLEALEIFRGENGYFNPKNDITRAQVAALIYRIHTGDVKDTHVALYADAARFNDEIPTWAKGYVGYCANSGLIKGYADGTFRPNGKVTGFEALVMVLRAIGYGKVNEFTGANWSTNAAALAAQLHITDNVKPGLLVGPATREVVAEILFRTIIQDQVTYTPAFGYAANSVVAGKGSLAAQNFHLTKIDGVVTGVDYDKGITYMGGYAVANTDANWEYIGFQAETWAIDVKGDKYYYPMTDIKVTGEVLFDTNNGTTWAKADETKVLPEFDSDVQVWVNGVYAGLNNFTAVKNAMAKVGVRVQFVDNDTDAYYYHGGRVESVVIYEYTASQVKAIASETNTGYNAYKPGYTYFTGNKAVKTEDVVCDEALVVGQFVTYIQYEDEVYVDVAESLTKQNYSKMNVNIENRNLTTYVIGGETYLLAASNAGDTKFLGRGYLTEDLNIWLDPYGHLVAIDEYIELDNHLFVVRHNHTLNVEGTTYATVAFVDGTVANVYLTKAQAETFKTIESDMYKFTTSNDTYEIAATCDVAKDVFTGEVLDLDYVKGTSTLAAGVYLTKNSVVIDVRDVARNATSCTVYTGYNEVPTLNDADFHYVVDKQGFVVYAFLSDGTAPSAAADKSLEFIAYRTDAYYSTSEKVWIMPAIVKGVETDVTLTADQYADVLALGVGHYVYDKAATLTYTSFAETWADIIWKDGAVVIGTTAYTYDDATVAFYSLDIAKGLPHKFVMEYGADVKAYVVKGASAATEIYLIYGTEAPAGTLATYTKGGAYKYYAQDGFVTVADKQTLPTTTYATLLADLEKAINTLNDAIAAAAAKANVKLAGATDDLLNLLDAVDAAAAAVEKAATALETYATAEGAPEMTATQTAKLASLEALATAAADLWDAKDDAIKTGIAKAAVKGAVADYTAAVKAEDAAAVTAALENIARIEKLDNTAAAAVLSNAEMVIYTAAVAEAEEVFGDGETEGTAIKAAKAKALDDLEAAIVAAVKADADYAKVAAVIPTGKDLFDTIIDDTYAFAAAVKVYTTADKTDKVSTLDAAYTAWTAAINNPEEVAGKTELEVINSVVATFNVKAVVEAYMDAAVKSIAADAAAAAATVEFKQKNAAVALVDATAKTILVVDGSTLTAENYANYINVKMSDNITVDKVTLKDGNLTISFKDVADDGIAAKVPAAVTFAVKAATTEQLEELAVKGIVAEIKAIAKITADDGTYAKVVEAAETACGANATVEFKGDSWTKIEAGSMATVTFTVTVTINDATETFDWTVKVVC